jgi:hypothetical protein
MVIKFVARFLQKFVMNQGEDSTPSKYYAMSALTYLVAMVTSNKALTWVNYPTQVKKQGSVQGLKVTLPLFGKIVNTLPTHYRHQATKWKYTLIIIVCS